MTPATRVRMKKPPVRVVLTYFFFPLLARSASIACFISKRFFVLWECLDPFFCCNVVARFAMPAVYINCGFLLCLFLVPHIE